MADWKSIEAAVGKYAPLLGTIIGGPAAPIAGALIAAALGVPNEPAAIQQAITADPEIAVKLQQIQSDNSIRLQELMMTAESNRLVADTAQMQAINATMQTEAKSDHWPSYSWRPYCGFIFGTMFLGTYFILPLCKLTVPAVPTEAWLAMGGVLGVASFFRGKAQANTQLPADSRG